VLHSSTVNRNSQELGLEPVLSADREISLGVCLRNDLPVIPLQNRDAVIRLVPSPFEIAEPWLSGAGIWWSMEPQRPITP
jgi:hypothetical protein